MRMHLAAAVVAVLAALPARAAVHTVASGGELSAALDIAVGGDEIVLADGAYGDLDLGGRVYADYVTIRGGRGARFTGAWNPPATQAAFIRLDGFTIDGGLYLFGLGTAETHHIEALRLAIGPVDGNDLMQIIGDVHDVRIEGCEVRDSIATDPLAHPDLLQMFMDFGDGDTPADITLRRNLFWDDAATGVIGAQGVFVSDAGAAGYIGILVEENIIHPALVNALTIQSAVESSAFRRNLVTSGHIWIADNQGRGNAGLTVEGNVAPALTNDGGGATVGDNYVGDVTGYLAGYTDGSTLDQYRPAPGSPIEPYLGWLIAILDGQPQPPEDPMLTILSVVCALGSAVIEADQTLTYTPPLDFVGQASCQYTIEDDEALQDTGTVTVTVAGVPPTANDDSAATQKNTPVNIDVLANDQAG